MLQKKNSINFSKANNSGATFPSQFCLGSISNKFSYTEAEEVSLKENVYDFANDYGTIAAYDIRKWDSIKCLGL